MHPRQFATIVAGLIVTVGFILLFRPIHSSANGINTSCGSVAHKSDNVNVNAMTADLNATFAGRAATNSNDLATACDSALATEQTWAFALLGIGVIVGIGARVVRVSPARPASPTDGPA